MKWKFNAYAYQSFHAGNTVMLVREANDFVVVYYPIFILRFKMLVQISDPLLKSRGEKIDHCENLPELGKQNIKIILR